MKLRLNGEFHNFPDFLIVGAAKCGTSSLHHYLSEHPGVFLPQRKELYFWHQNRNPNHSVFNYCPAEVVPTDLMSYLEWFASATQGQMVGEACPSYLYYHDIVIQSLKELHPNWDKVKIVIILRDPLRRIISQYRMVKQYRLDPDRLGFAESIRQESHRRTDPNYPPAVLYLSLALYSSQVKAYLNAFPNVKILLFEDLASDPRGLMKDLCEFLGVDKDPVNSIDFTKRHNVSTAARVGRFRGAPSTFDMLRGWGGSMPSFLRAPAKKLLDRVLNTDEEFDPATIHDLKLKLQPDVKKVEELIGRNLSCWTSVLE